jgi:two-component system phosphate regulon sensor histidine kinase PhoR
MVSGVSRTAPAKLLALFALLSGVPLLALGWLGWRVLEQDRVLENQRQRERLENAASLIARELDVKFSDWEQLLAAGARGESIAVPQGGVFLLIGPDGVAARQGAPLPYYPRVAPPATVPSALFAVGDALEFREQNLVAALASNRQLAASKDDAIRGEALVRMARCLRKLRRNIEALETYDRLAVIRTASIAGSPAELVARRERIALMMEGGDTDGAAREQRLLSSALAEGRYPIDRATFEFFSELTSSVEADGAPRPLASAVEALWSSWLEQPTGRSTIVTSSGTFVTVWRKAAGGIAALTLPLAVVTVSIEDAGRSLQVTAQLDDRVGKTMWGRVDDAARVSKSTRETGLPWSLHVAAGPSSASALVDSRRNLFVAGFGLIALVIAAAGYFVSRAVTRELRVAQLQSDFVAAVSHEFRTPLTAMCHLTEMLEQGNMNSDRLPEYYRALGKESRRLHAMVENVLDFKRMDAGRRAYNFRETDAIDLIDNVTQEYTDRVPGAASRIEKVLPDHGPAFVRADQEALALAIRNLLDNAMKYSPASSPVRVTVASQNGTVAVSVADHGAGIGAQERREIFRKFTRGAAARTLNVKGTGIGLTMADQIVKAHGGRLELESDPGFGSTFTIVLPVAS